MLCFKLALEILLMKTLITIYAVILLGVASTFYGQRPPCGPSPLAGESACLATPMCDFNGYRGTTNGYADNAWTELDNALCAATNTWYGCFTTENDSYLKFIAPSTSISLGVYVYGCVSSSKSVQIAVFSSASCNSGNVNLVYTTTDDGISQTNYAITPFAINITGLTIGTVYYILVDGTGKIVKQQAIHLDAKTKQLIVPQTKDFSAGIYLLRMHGNQAAYSTKFYVIN